MAFLNCSLVLNDFSYHIAFIPEKFVSIALRIDSLIKKCSIFVGTKLSDLKRVLLILGLRHVPSQTELNSYSLYLNGKELADNQTVEQLSIPLYVEINCTNSVKNIIVVFCKNEHNVSVDSMSRVKDITVISIVWFKNRHTLETGV